MHRRNEFTLETPASPTVPYPLPTKSSVSVSDEDQLQVQPTVETFWSVEEQGSTKASFNDCNAPGHKDEVSGDDHLTDTCRTPSPEGCDKDASPVTNWEKDSSANWDNAPSSWGIEWSDSPGPAGGLFRPDEPPKENWRNEKLRPESKSWLHSLSFGKPAHTLSDEEYKDIMDLHVLPLATRLEDEDWLDSPLEHIRVDDELLFRQLTKGRELAQKCLWSFMDKNRPEIRRREFPGGWQQVKLEVTVLIDVLQPGALDFRQNNPQRARNAAFAVVPLRHLTCHWNKSDLGWSRPAPRMVDRHLKNVQKLAIHLYDEECAAEARKLRDEARELVENTVSEVEALEPLFDVYAWKYHHEQMFEQIEFAKDEKTPDLYRYPDVILRAAEAWSRRHRADLAMEGLMLQEEINTTEIQCKIQGEKIGVETRKEDAKTATKHQFTHRILNRRHSSSGRGTPTASIDAEEQVRSRRSSNSLTC